MTLLDLLETRAAPLYHGCALGAAVKIITTGTIEDRTTHLMRPGAAQRSSITGVSLSRSRHAALAFGSIVFAFDQARLRQRHRIVPQDFWGHSKEPALMGSGRRQGRFAEAEEFVLGPIHDALGYVTGISITEKQLIWAQRHCPDFAEPLLTHRLLKMPAPTA